MKEPIIQHRLNIESLWLLNHKEIENDKIKIIILGDSHVNTMGWDESINNYLLDANGKRYVKILNHIRKFHDDALFILHGGDTIGTGISLKDNEEKHENMRAFVNVTKDILFKNQLPIFVSIGDGDYIMEDNELNPKLFLQYIGDEVNNINILDTKLNLITINPMYDANSINFLKNALKNNNQDYYILDFHVPLKHPKLVTLFNNNPIKEKDQLLSLKETNLLINLLSKNVIGLFNHHIHISTQLNIEGLPFLISSCAGNSNSSKYPNYYVVEIENIYNRPIISKINEVYVF